MDDQGKEKRVLKRGLDEVQKSGKKCLAIKQSWFA